MVCSEDTFIEYILFFILLGYLYINFNINFCYIMNIKSNKKYGILKLSLRKILFFFIFMYFF